MKKALPALLSFSLFCTALELLSVFGFLNKTLFPSPSQIFFTFQGETEYFLQAWQQTVSNVAWGYLSSFCLGFVIAILFSFSAFLQSALLPFALFFQTVPIIAIAPLLVVYFGFGDPTVKASSLIVSIFPIIANTLVGLSSAPSGQSELFKIYNASHWQTLYRLKIPTAFPYIISGLKISAGLSIIGAIAGEFVAGGGLGAIIDTARTQQRIDQVFVCLFLLAVTGLLMLVAVQAVQKALQRWRPL